MRITEFLAVLIYRNLTGKKKFGLTKILNKGHDLNIIDQNMGFRRLPLDKMTLREVWDKWPGDESIGEILAALQGSEEEG